MNIKFDIDMTPEELRRLIGLPDVKTFNDKIMEQMMQKMQENSFDPSLFMKASIMGPELMKQWTSAFSQFRDQASENSKDENSDQTR